MMKRAKNITIFGKGWETYSMVLLIISLIMTLLFIVGILISSIASESTWLIIGSSIYIMLLLLLSAIPLGMGVTALKNAKNCKLPTHCSNSSNNAATSIVEPS